MYFVGWGVALDYAEATKWLLRAAEQGFAEAQCNLGVIYGRGLGVLKDDAASLAWYRRAAENGCDVAQYNLGAKFRNGDGVPQDFTEALKWYRLASDQGYARAQVNLGTMYRDGEGVEANRKEMAHWYTRAAEQGFPLAEAMLGFLYETGDTVPKDESTAIGWYKRGAEHGSDMAQYMLGQAFARGNGVPSNLAEAATLYGRAAQQGNALAQFALAQAYRNGYGLKKDYSEALKWYDRAAAQGNSSAQYDLGIMYAYGEGVPKNAVRAYAWFNVVAAGGDSTAARLREETAQGMTPDQIAEAQRISSDFRAQPERSRPVEQADGTLTERTNVTGSGFFVTDDGYFVTNHHVIVGASRIAVRTSAGTLPATVVRVDAANDLAVLKLNGKFSSLCVLGSKEPKRSDRVATMGFPNPRLQGLLPKFSSGEVAALSGPRDDPRFLQISVPTQPGNSGGPLVDASGVVIGVIVAQLDKIEAFKATGNIPENVNYAIKGTILRAVLESIPDLSLKSQTDIVPTNHSEVVDVVERAIGLVLVEH